MPEDVILVGSQRAAGFVPAYIVDVSELDSSSEGSLAVLYIAAAAVVVTAACGAAALKVRRGRAQA